ncbi:choice-of-anchor B family protein [Aureitalea sp. L0-47]|nr:choice-of-anchor B family protein [Aureitalea sp. L0-47]
MKKLLLLGLSVLSTLALAQTPCDNGMAGNFPCNGYELLASFTLGDLGGATGNDSWGWTDTNDGKEYAITGVDNGTVFIDISDPVNPVILGKLLGHNNSSSLWRDVKVYNNHAFMVSEASGHGIQIFDLTRLRDVTNPPENFTPDAHFNGFGSAHNIVINEDTGYAYGVGTSQFSGGAIFVNIQNPTNPVVEGGYAGSGYTHDAQVVVYSGPDSDYTGREIYFACNTDEVVIVDVTDKNNPQLISTIGYANIGYTHQGWLTEDQTYFIAGDEFDESNVGFNTRSVVFDFTDLDNPMFHLEYFGPTPAIDHNGYVKGDRFYIANYAAGMRVVDISDIANGNMTEIGYFDTHPDNQNVSYTGAWNVYPYFESGNIIVSNIDGGFFIVRDENLGLDPTDATNFGLAPNPASDILTIRSELNPIQEIEISNMLGQQVFSASFENSDNEQIDISSLSTGMYLVRINNNTVKRLLVN